jgi:amphiphysin
MEKESKGLQKDAKTYLDSMRTMSSSQQRIAETITLFYTADKQSEVSCLSRL